MAKYVVYTPLAIAARMRGYIDTSMCVLDPAVGEGALLQGVTHADVYDISQEALSTLPSTFTLHNTDFLDASIPTQYKSIISNPPYQRFQDMSDEMRQKVQSIPGLERGNVDLYVAFMMKCLSLLADGGTFVCITPSTWLFNKSCKAFREYIYTHRLLYECIDFGSEKVFEGVDVYCCISVFRKCPTTHFLYNGKSIPYTTLSPLSLMGSVSQGRTLSSIAKIQNGIATLADKVFIHPNRVFPEPCWKPIIKVSKGYDKMCIVPYGPEETFAAENPYTYSYLQSKKSILAQRDKGKKTYALWYDFGRQQSLTIPSEPESVYISTLCHPDILPSIRIKPTQLFYSGLRITPVSGVSCQRIVDILMAADIESVCSKRGGGWLNVTATVLKSIKIE